METHIHMIQVVMLLTSLEWHWRGRNDYFASGNLSIYYPVMSREGRVVRQKLACRGPDFFVVRGAKSKPQRNSWVVENEDGLYPNVIFEVLSKSTRAVDRGKKKSIYGKIFRTPEYFLFEPRTCKLEGYRLVRGRYVPIKPDASGRLLSEELGVLVGLQVWEKLDHEVVRLFTLEGKIIPTFEETIGAALEEKARFAARSRRETTRVREAEAKAEQAEREKAQAEAKATQAEREKVQAEREKAQAEREKARIEREKAQAEAKAAQAEQEKALLLAKLSELGVDPGEVRQGRKARGNRRSEG